MFKRLIMVLALLSISVGSYGQRETQGQQFPNLLNESNAGFENGGAKWVASPTSTFSLESSDVGRGASSGKFDATTTGQFLRSELVPVPPDHVGKECIARASLKGGDANLKFQAYDGTNVLKEIVLQTFGEYTDVEVDFLCQTGNIAVRIISTADAAEIKIDSASIGKNFVGSVSQAAFVGRAEWASDPSCAPLTNSATFATLDLDNDCNSPTVTGELQIAVTKIPEVTIPNAAPGEYFVTWGGFTIAPLAASVTCTFAINGNGVFRGRRSMVTDGAGTEKTPKGALVASFTHTSGDLVLGLAAKREGTSSGCRALNDSENTTMFVNVMRFPTETAKTFTASTTPFEVDVSLFGGVMNLGVVDVSTYTRITSSDLTLEIHRGSQFVPQITCASGTPSEGLTCNGAAVDENIGVSVILPTSGVLEVCIEFTNFMRLDPTFFTQTFQLVRTADNTSSITDFEEEGNSKTHIDAGENINNQNKSWPIHTCGRFQIPGKGRHAFRLYREFDFISGIIEANQIRPDRSSAGGQRDIHITMNYISQNLPFPVIVDTIVSPEGTGGQFRLVHAEINCDGTPGVTIQGGSWVTSVDQNSTGSCDINIAVGIFSSEPVCTISPEGGSNSICLIHSASQEKSATEIRTFCHNTAVTPIDVDYDIICVGLK